MSGVDGRDRFGVLIIDARLSIHRYRLMPASSYLETEPALDPPGRVVALEGIDGCGTTTQARRLACWLGEQGRRAIYTAEPSDGAVGKLIRTGLACDSSEKLAPDVLALLFAADRLDHLARRVVPALGQGTIVVTDRSVLSSLVYQAESLDYDWVASINARAPLPHLALWLDLPVKECLWRIAARGRPRDRYEHADLLARLHARYSAMCEHPDPRCPLIRLDAIGTREQVAARIQAALHAAGLIL